MVGGYQLWFARAYELPVYRVLLPFDPWGSSKPHPKGYAEPENAEQP